MKTSATAVICLSHNGGGMELDALKTATLLSDITDVTLIAKSNTFLEKSYHEKARPFELETLNFYKTISYSIFSNVRKYVKKHAIKNVIFFGASELKSIHFALLGLDINLIIRHGTTKSTPKKDWLHTLIYSNVNYHVAMGEHLAQNVKTIIPFAPKSQLRIIPPSYTLTPLRKPQNSNNKIKLLHVGRIVPGKGQMDAIKACAILYENEIEFELTLVGAMSEKYHDTFNTTLDALPYKSSINCIGFTNEVESYIQKADIFLFPSYGEGFGNAFIEAMSQNLIGITYENTSFKDFKQLELYFHPCEDRNIEALSHTLLHVVQNIEIEKERSTLNHETIKNLFSVENELANYQNILQ